MTHFTGQRPAASAGMVAKVPRGVPHTNASILAWDSSYGRNLAERWFRQKSSAALLGVFDRNGD